MPFPDFAPPSAEIRELLAPGGVLRAGINMSNFLLVSSRTADGGPAGVSPDMARVHPSEPVTPPTRENVPPPVDAAEGSRLPLKRILEIVARVSPGEVIEVELDEDDDVEVYEVKTLTPEGRAIETTVHARTGQVLDREED